MKMILIAVHYNARGAITGYRIMDKDNGDITDQPSAKIEAVLRNGLSIEGLKLERGKIKGSNGSIDRYTKLLNNLPLRNEQGIAEVGYVVIKSLDDLGYVIADFNGNTIKIKTQELINSINDNPEFKLANGKIVSGQNGDYVSSIIGSYENEHIEIPSKKPQQTVKPVAQAPIKPVVQVKAEDKKEVRKTQKETNIDKKHIQILRPRNFVYGTGVDKEMLNMVDPVSNLSVENKIIYMEYAIKTTRPFYYYILASLDRKYTTEIPTMGVSITTFYINPNFIYKMSLPELVFIGIHEIIHVALKHPYRKFKFKPSDLDVWATAVDMTVNEFLIDEFQLSREYIPRPIRIKKGDSYTDSSHKIALPSIAITNPNVDLKVDTVESLYLELMKLKKQEQQEQQKSNDMNNNESGDSEGSNQSDSQSQQNEDGSQADGPNLHNNQNNQQDGGQDSQSGGQDSQSGGQDSQSGGQDSQSGGMDNSESTQDGVESGNSEQSSDNKEHKDSSGNNTNQGNNQGSSNGAANDKHGSNANTIENDDCLHDIDKNKLGQTNSNGESVKEDIGANKGNTSEGADASKGKRNSVLTGKEFRGFEIKAGFGDDLVEDRNTPITDEEAKQLSNGILARAVTTAKKHIAGFGGDQASYIERLVIESLAPKVNWVTLLKNLLTLASQKVNTFAAPDKRFRSRGMIMPGPKKLENDSLENVKICVDTSGSISSEDIGIALSQIKQLLKTYRAKAELLYWDTRIRAVYPFESIEDIVSKKPMGGGGTDANCIFDYFETNHDYKIGKKAKPSIIIVFTDGYFGEIDTKYKKYKDTIWVINGNNTSFQHPFGKKASFKIED